MSLATRSKSATAGFTIIEALVALALVTAVLAAIAPLMATSSRGVRSVEQHVALAATARTIAAGLPQREVLAAGGLSGELAGHRWRVDALPFSAAALGPASSSWVPQTIVITVRSPSGAALRIDTVRLHRRSNG